MERVATITGIDDILLRDWEPRSQLRAEVSRVPVASMPCIDVHNHLGRWLGGGEWTVPNVKELLSVMDESHVEAAVNLDGLWGDELEANLDRYDRRHPGRFYTFCQIEWERLADPDGLKHLTRQLEDSARRGARGVKIWKTLGLGVRGADGRLIPPDDPRVIALVRRAGDLGLPVLIHTADPRAFFDPLDAHNERLDELRGGARGWYGDRDRYPTFDALLSAHAALVLASPQTQIIGAHVGCAAEDLDMVERLLRAAPNYHVDIAGRLAELGRQPRRFAKLVRDYPRRILFGTDSYPPTREAYELHFRFLETSDESFDYDPGERIPMQGRWCISAAHLDEPLLRLVYRENATRLLNG